MKNPKYICSKIAPNCSISRKAALGVANSLVCITMHLITTCASTSLKISQIRQIGKSTNCRDLKQTQLTYPLQKGDILLDSKPYRNSGQ